MPAPWIKPSEDLKEVTDDVLNRNYDDVISNAENNPGELLDIPSGDYDLLLEGMATAVDETHENTINGGDNEADESTISTAKIVGGYFVIQAMRRAFHRVHSATVARQVPDDEVEETQESALLKGLADVTGIADNELGQTYHEAITDIFNAKGVTQYKWVHCLCGNERPEHLARHGNTYSVGEPAGDEPGQAYNCRCYADEIEPVQARARTMKKTKALNIKAEAGKVQVDIRGPIFDEAWDEEEVGVNQIISQLDKMGDIDEINLSIYSKGGDAHAGGALYSYLTAHDATITADIYGLAASAATMIAAAADKVTIGKADAYLVHHPWGLAMGNFEDMFIYSQDLESLSGMYATAYAERTGMDKDDILALMSEDRYMDADEALEKGFVTEIRTKSAQACVGGFCAPQNVIDDMSADIRDKYIGQQHHRAAVKQSRLKSKSFLNSDQDQSMTNDELKARVKELEAQNKVLESDNGAKKDEIADLEKQAMSDDDRKKLRADVRAEVEADIEDAEKVRSEAQDKGFKAEGKTAIEVKRNVVSEVHANAADELDGKSLDNIYQMALSTRAKKESDDVDNTFSGTSEPKDDNPFAQMKAVGGK